MRRPSSQPEVRAGRVPHAAAALLRAFVGAGHASAAALAVVRPDATALFAVGRCRAVRASGDGDAGGEAPDPWRPSPGRAIDLDTPFDLASLTKPMVTLGLVARGLADGSLGLDDPLARHLPAAAAQPAAALPLRALLGHASGWPAWRDFAGVFDGPPLRPSGARDLGLRQDLAAAVLATAAERPAGSAAVYSDLGYLVLGFLLEATLHKPLDVAAFELLAPLPVASPPTYRRTPVGLSPRDPAVVATEVWPRRCRDGWPLQGVVHDDNAAALQGVAGHAGLFGGVRAVAAWAQAWLAAVVDGTTGLGGALDPAVARALVSGAAAPDTTWRLGFDTPSQPTSSAGARWRDGAFGHLGFVGTSVWFDPRSASAVVLLTNRVHRGRAIVAPIRALRPAVHDAVWEALARRSPD